MLKGKRKEGIMMSKAEITPENVVGIFFTDCEYVSNFFSDCILDMQTCSQDVCRATIPLHILNEIRPEDKLILGKLNNRASRLGGIAIIENLRIRRKKGVIFTFSVPRKGRGGFFYWIIPENDDEIAGVLQSWKKSEISDDLFPLVLWKKVKI